VCRLVTPGRPRVLAWQRCVGHRIEVRPEPSRFKDFVDGFGNTVRALHFDAEHDNLFVHSESWVELEPRPMTDPEHSPAWESVRDGLRYRAGQRIDSEALQGHRLPVRVDRRASQPEIAVAAVPEAEFTDPYSDAGLPSLALRYRDG